MKMQSESLRGWIHPTAKKTSKQRKWQLKHKRSRDKRRLKNGTDKHRAHAANFAGRLLIGVMNSEKKYRHTLESSRDSAEPKGTLC